MSYGAFLKACGTYSRKRQAAGLPCEGFEAEHRAVRDIWLAEKRYAALIAFILDNWGAGYDDSFAIPVSERLLADGETALFIRLWRGLLRLRMEAAWPLAGAYGNLHPAHTAKDVATVDLSGFNPFTNAEPVERQLAWQWKRALEAQNTFIDGLARLEQGSELERQRTALEYLHVLQMPPGPNVSDKRRIDEAVFWQLIDESRAAGAPNGEFLDRLRVRLEAFRPAQLKTFNRLLLKFMSELHTWDHWALAYLVRGGCGDDAFDDFRAWAVSKGRDAFTAIRDLNAERLATLFDEDPQLEELMSLAGEIYDERSGEELPEPRLKLPGLRRTPWKESELAGRYPELTRSFGGGD